MAQLLISVRSAAEAETAVRGNADWIDVKEPAHGPLGRAADTVIADVVRQVGRRAPVSAALGELAEWGRGGCPPVPPGLALVKVGLSGCDGQPDWPRRWTEAAESLPGATRMAAVVYADWQTARAPSPQRVLDECVCAGCSAVLVDTFDKTAGGLLAHWTLDAVDRFVRGARDRGMLVALAGSLAEGSIGEVLGAAPDIVAVRGAACRGGRRGEVDAERVRALAGLLEAANRQRGRQIA